MRSRNRLFTTRKVNRCASSLQSLQVYTSVRARLKEYRNFVLIPLVYVKCAESQNWLKSTGCTPSKILFRERPTEPAAMTGVAAFAYECFGMKFSCPTAFQFFEIRRFLCPNTTQLQVACYNNYKSY